MQTGFLLNIPIIHTKNIYRMKSVLKIETPALVACQNENPDLHLVPNLYLCTVIKDIHWLCPSKPFVRDPLECLCGIKRLTKDDKCNAVATHMEL